MIKFNENNYSKGRGADALLLNGCWLFGVGQVVN